MPLSWNEIRQRSIAFSREWATAARERAESQSFWNDFFHVFGKSRRAVASFEEPVRNLAGNTDFIDLIWKGRVIVVIQILASLRPSRILNANGLFYP